MPSEDDFNEWLGHPTTGWVMDIMRKRAAAQKALWSDLAWSGDLDPLLHREAHVRADCYLAIPESSYEDWVVNDTEA